MEFGEIIFDQIESLLNCLNRQKLTYRVEFSDVKIVSKEVTIPAHKIVLICSSEYLKKYLLEHPEIDTLEYSELHGTLLEVVIKALYSEDSLYIPDSIYFEPIEIIVLQLLRIFYHLDVCPNICELTIKQLSRLNFIDCEELLSLTVREILGENEKVFSMKDSCFSPPMYDLGR